jgi:TfoX/Sxy family transcriptional regulator of competence genes
VSNYNKKLEDLLDHQLISNDKLHKRKELGGVGYLINGNMCLGIYDNFLVARIGKYLAQSLVNRPGIKPYTSDNDEFDDFILVAEQIYEHPKALRKFIDQAIKYTSGLSEKNHQNKV